MIVIFPAELKPWLAATAVNVERPALSCVFVDPDGFLVATDQHLLAVAPARMGDVPEGFTGALIPAAFLDMAAGYWRKGPEPEELTLHLTEEAATLSTPWGPTACQLLQGQQFPNWKGLMRRVVAEARAAQAAAPAGGWAQHFNPYKLAVLSLALGISAEEDSRAIVMYQTGPVSPLIAFGRSGSFGFLMPHSRPEECPQLDELAELLG